MATLGIALMPEFPSDQYARLIRHCENLGYSNLWVPDERFWRDLTVCMTQAILQTDHMKIGSSVTDPFIRHPALTSQLMATLDELSGGRVVVGIGAGIAGFNALGIERKKPVLAIREAVELMRRLWTGKDVDYQGKVHQFHNASLNFKPPRSDIPIYIAGRGPMVLSLAGEIGDGVMIGSLASPQGLAYALNQVDRGLNRSGRNRQDIEVTLWLHTAIADDEAVAQEAVRTIVTGALISSLNSIDDIGLDIPQHVLDALQGVTYGVNSPGMLMARHVIESDVIQHFALAGNPKQCGEQIRQIIDGGVQHFAILPWLAPGQTMEQFVTMLVDAVGPEVTLLN